MSLGFYLKNILISIGFAVTFLMVYILFLNHYFDYAGFTYFPKPAFFIYLALFLAVLPIIFYRGIQETSSFIALFIYILLYVPSVLTFALGSDQSLFQIFIIQSFFLIGMVLFFSVDRFSLELPVTFGFTISMKIMLVITVLAIGYVLFIYRNNLNLVSFEDVYIQRSANSKLGTDILSRYLSSWLFNFLIPICLAYGLLSRRNIFFWVGCLGCLIIYMATAAKSAILLPPIYFIFYQVFSRVSSKYLYPILSTSIALVMIIMLQLNFNMVSSIFLSRTIGNGGLSSLSYYNFFSNHPLTYYSHINFINFLTHDYPYGSLGLGEVVGQFFWSEEMNANAHFWAADGFASIGPSGILIVSFVMFVFFLVLNSVSRIHNKLFCVLCLLPFVLSLTNVSFFQSMWTGGGIFMLGFFALIPKEIFIRDLNTK